MAFIFLMRDTVKIDVLVNSPGEGADFQDRPMASVAFMLYNFECSSSFIAQSPY